MRSWIKLTRINHNDGEPVDEAIHVNTHQIIAVQKRADHSAIMTPGRTLAVRETPAEVMERIAETER